MSSFPRTTLAHPTTNPDVQSFTKGLRLAFGRKFFCRLCVEVIFVDDKAISELAGRFRGSPHPTDVLAFSYGKSLGMRQSGEIYISLDVAKRQAVLRKIPVLTELILLGVHGSLHLAGQDDESPSSWKKMRQLEFTRLMSALGEGDTA